MGEDKSLADRLAALKAKVPPKAEPTPEPPEPPVKPVKPVIVLAPKPPPIEDDDDEDNDSEYDPIDDEDDEEPEPPRKAPLEAKSPQLYVAKCYLLKGYGKRYDCGHYHTCITMFKGGGDAHCPKDCEFLIAPEQERATDFMRNNGYFWQ